MNGYVSKGFTLEVIPGAEMRTNSAKEKEKQKVQVTEHHQVTVEVTGAQRC